MLVICLFFAFFAVFTLIVAMIPLKWDERPTLKLNVTDGIAPPVSTKRGRWVVFLSGLAVINKPLVIGPLGRRMAIDLGRAQVPMFPEEFMLIKEILVGVLVTVVLLVIRPDNPQILFFGVLMSLAAGYYLPELWLKARAAKVRDSIIRDLPDTVDLLGLCVNAGLDFMMALKYVVEKSKDTYVIEELKNMMQEINMGKPRRDALRDLARRHELPDLSTFSRTLIQADRMGTSVSEALNILSEDMRDARFRRGEAMALKAPLKMLIPLLFFIFPVVAILVAGPVFLDFFQNNPLQNLGK